MCAAWVNDEISVKHVSISHSSHPFLCSFIMHCTRSLVLLINVRLGMHTDLLKNLNHYYHYHTESFCEKTPNSLMTWGWWNCPMMAASCKSFTRLTLLSLVTRVFTATSVTPLGDFKVPLLTLPNCPDPNNSSILFKTQSNLVMSVNMRIESGH